jgi:hypothetical protein
MGLSYEMSELKYVMNKEDSLSNEFLNQFKAGDALYSFLAKLQKRGIEKMLEGEPL